MKIQRRLQIKIGHGVAADDQKGIVQILFCVLDTAGCSQWNVFDGVADAHVPLTAIAEVILDQICHVLEGDDHIAEPVMEEQVSDMGDYRLVYQGNHWLGPAYRQRPQA